VRKENVSATIYPRSELVGLLVVLIPQVRRGAALRARVEDMASTLALSRGCSSARNFIGQNGMVVGWLCCGDYFIHLDFFERGIPLLANTSCGRSTAVASA